ncbi:MAG: N-6 DNA methylase [Micromonosporaceae bacterium]|nr:N-6 DNA methylase [Micromonosporaceae bacterium]
MDAAAQVPTERLVSAAEVARIAGVTRAAVSNWRRRYPDFPAPVGGGRNALFPEPAVREWLQNQRKGSDVSGEVLVWQALRSQYHDEIVQGVADVAGYLLDGTSGVLNPATQRLVDGVSADSSPPELAEALAERLASSTSRTETQYCSTPRLVRVVQQFVGPVSGTVFDPACGAGSLLLAVANGQVAQVAGQELSESAARLAWTRARLAGQEEVVIRHGDSLRDDQWPGLRADLVVCDPPPGTADWGREELLLDRRWEFGVPTRGESELAWVQHCFAHTAPGGTALIVLPTSAAYRKAGRRIRAELVRRGVLIQIVALPPGMDSVHAQPVHLWLLRRPGSPEDAVTTVRMVDLTGEDPDEVATPAPDHTAEVPLIELLDETVDLTPTRHVRARRIDQVKEFSAIRESLLQQCHELLPLLPSLTGGCGTLDGAMVKVADLARAGLVEFADGIANSASDQLDNDFLNGFLRSAANIARSTSASGTFRIDARAARLPQMSIDEQRRYGTAFRDLDEFERRIKEIARLGEQAASLARDGLTTGALNPPRSDH